MYLGGTLWKVKWSLIVNPWKWMCDILLCVSLGYSKGYESLVAIGVHVQGLGYWSYYFWIIFIPLVGTYVDVILIVDLGLLE